jgi:hypothetical protein
VLWGLGPIARATSITMEIPVAMTTLLCLCPSQVAQLGEF